MLTESARRGRTVFYRDDVGCARCHVPPRFTDSTLAGGNDGFVLHDVGTLAESSGQRLGSELSGLDTPTLLGLWDSAPYLHDGRAAVLHEVLTRHNADDRHGRTSHLAERERNDLVVFLLSLDGHEDELPAAITITSTARQVTGTADTRHPGDSALDVPVVIITVLSTVLVGIVVITMRRCRRRSAPATQGDKA